MLGRAWRAAANVIVLSLWLTAFALIHAALGKDAAVATANAQALLSVEHHLHIDIERTANAWLAAHLALSHLAVYTYRLYYIAVAGVLIWAFSRNAEVYLHVRRVLIAMTALALPVYWAVPMSPPRFAMAGMVDIVAVYDIFPPTSAGPGSYSAMPSLHVGWALWCAYAAWCMIRIRHPRLALLPWLFPALMTAVVLGTGNHYVLDVAGSVVLVAVSVAVATLLSRLIPPRKVRP